jgi:Ca2+-binding RTX toxin-like protein
LQITIDDGGHNGSGGAKTATDTMTLHSVSFGTVRDGQVTFGSGDDSLDVHDVNMFGINSIHMGSGSNMLITSPTNMDVGTIFYDTDDTGGDDTGTLLFTPDQFYEIMTTAAFRTELQRYLDGDPGTGVFADTLDLSGSSWNAKVGGLETAWVAFSTGTDYVVYSAIGDNLPDYMTGQTGTDGNNTLVGTGPGQTLNGNGGNDILVAASGGNTLNGGAGSDVLLGGPGADVLNGGTGNDFLFGGKGADTFQFTGAFGNDTVLDFQHGQDVIEFEKTAFSDFADLIAHTTDDGHGTVTITHGSDSVVLKNVSAATLTANDFHFV